MTEVNFVYCPLSGDRVFAAEKHPAIQVIRWTNGCRHVVGGIHLEWEAADSGHWWRGRGAVALTAIVRAVGGIAWDDQGTLHAILPRQTAWKAAEVMFAVSEKRDGDPRYPAGVVGARLLVAGAGRLNDELMLIDDYASEEEDLPTPAQELFLTDGEGKFEIYVGATWFRAPAKWGPPQFEEGGDLPRKEAEAVE